MIMKWKTRKLIKPEDLNSRGTLFGGQLLKWIDEEAAIFAMCQLTGPTDLFPPNIVTKIISEVNFLSSPISGDIIEFGCNLIGFGRTSITLECEVRNKYTKDTIVKIDKIVFVCVDVNGNPKPHGFIK